MATNKVLDEGHFLNKSERTQILHLLNRITKSSQIYPQCLELPGVQCDLSQFPENEGGFGYIYRGKLKGQTVCVKVVRLSPTPDDKKSKKAFRAHATEFTLWSHISHPNVLPFLGVYVSANELVPRICIVSPWMKFGSLARFLESSPEAGRRILFLSDIISGLQHLHELKIIHSDLKADNVLVSSTYRAMLADFGASRISTVTPGPSTVADFTGTFNWMAPELLTVMVETEVMPLPTTASDMWAFGCTCYEVLTLALIPMLWPNSSVIKVMTGEIPFPEYCGPARLLRLYHAFSQLRATPSRPDEVDNDLEAVWPLLERCWHYTPEKRPSADEAKRFFDDMEIEDNRLPADDDDGMRLFTTLREERQSMLNKVTIDYDCVRANLLEVQATYRETLKNVEETSACSCQCHELA
ncbi:Serine/threonine-protein kinase HT1 [Leucoagaricus sp. SymC.cos]|nr:Serine/threonine-protein kinase HT1 [Leucoagaricus sp. SymC.cos]